MIKYLVTFLLTTPFYLSAQKPLQFVDEKIDFTLNNDHFTINGIYCFLNNSDAVIKQTILFPFSKDSDSVIVKRIFNLTYSENLSFQKLNNAVAFKIIFLPKDTVRVNIAYSQSTAKENIYVLESTQTWGQALIRADYSLAFDSSIQIDSLSLKPDSLVNNVYYRTKQNFFPDEDFKIWIK